MIARQRLRLTTVIAASECIKLLPSPLSARTAYPLKNCSAEEVSVGRSSVEISGSVKGDASIVDKTSRIL